MKSILLKVLVAITGLLFCAGMVGADERNLDYPHNSTNNITCWSCHYDESVLIDWETAPSDIDDTPWNRLCWSCHNDTDATFVKNHSSLATNSLNYTWPTLNTDDRFLPVMPASTVECRTCHFPHYNEQARYYSQVTWGWTFNNACALATGTVAAIDTTTVTVSGAGWTEDQWVGYLVVPNTSSAFTSFAVNGTYLSFNYKIVSNTADTLTVTGPINSNLTAGSTMAIYYGKLIRDEIETPNSGTKTVKFYDKTGANSFADGDATRDGVCEVCHTQVTHFRNDGTGSQQLHENLDGKAGVYCIQCHDHNAGFGHGGGKPCVTCHGHDTGTNFDPDMTSPYAAGATASEGTGTSHSHSTHTETDSDDAKGPGIYCADCHDITKIPYFKSGVDGNADGNFNLAETDVCDTCHSKNGTYDGVDDPVVGAKANWADGIYESDDVTLRAGKEKWCATCHGENPSVIQAIAAPNVIGDEDAVSPAYIYDNSGATPGWGFYKTGHGLPSTEDYPASGGLTAGAGKECIDCHDPSTSHIDGNARSFDCSDGCDSDEYQASYRLNLVGGENPINLPLNQASVPPVEENYRLCFSSSGCHMPEKYLLTGNDYGTSFRDDLGESPDAGRSLTAPINAHEYHLNATSFGIQFSADWRDPPDDYKNSNISCISCHNVHGSSQLGMIRTGNLIDKGAGMEMWYHKDGVSDPSATTLADSEGTYWNATSSGNLCHVCHGSYQIYHRTPPAPQTAPVLAWTGEANYTVDGVDPESGVSGTSFYFRVNYTDANYDLPATIQLWMDEDDSGTYEADEKYDMLEVDSGDRNCSDGKLYKKIQSVLYAGDGELHYKFYAADKNADATGDPVTLTTQTITVSKIAPTLDWTGEDGYTSDGVSPNTAVGGSDFTFRVEYTDASNLAPSLIQVCVDKDDSGTCGDVGGEEISLTEANGADEDYTDGKIFTTTTALAYAGDGALIYNFAAEDSESTPATGTPTADRTLTVNEFNSAPLLSWTNAENYVRDGVDPDTGIDGETFTFKIQYLDVDNNVPTSMQVWVDLNDDDDYEDVGEKIDMVADNAGDTDYSDGKLYSKDVDIDAVGDGLINYRFYASDGTVDATGTPANDSIVTLLVDAVTVTCPGESLQTAITAASDGDTILVADGTCTENITIDGKDLTIRAINGPTMAIIDGSDGGGNTPVFSLINGADTVLDGLKIQNGARTWGFYGAGIYISESSPTINNCVIDSNSTTYDAAGLYLTTTSSSVVTITDSTFSNNSAGRNGGAIFMEQGGTVVMSGCTVAGNSAADGGGFYLYDGTGGATSSFTMVNSTFDGNTATHEGGGIYANAAVATSDIQLSISAGSEIKNSTATAYGAGLYLKNVGATFVASITDSTVSYNINSGGTSYGGGLYAVDVNPLTVSGCTFDHNEGARGGGLLFDNGTTNNVFTISDTSILSNIAGGYGGGIYLEGDGAWTPTLDRCVIAGNSVTNWGGGVYATATVPVTFTNCLVTGNKATEINGGGFYLNGASVNATIFNSTFSGNSAVLGLGGGICAVDSAVATLTNTIMWGNKAVSSVTDEISGTAVTASYSDIGQTGYEGNNNLNVDPMFVSATSYTLAPITSGDYHLEVDSPVVDMGTATGAPDDDIDGDFRYSGAGYDMGSDEVITGINSAPALSWTGETNYSSDGVNPDIGADGASFEFRINYVDADDNPPVTLQVWVDKNDDGDYLDAGEKVALVEVDGGDTSYTDGKLYSTSMNLNYTDNNGLYYRFYGDDGVAVATGTPVANHTLLVNDAPTLSWLADAGYDGTDGANPDSDLSGSNFVFKIKYTDANNNPPSSIQVWIDKNDDADFADAGEMITMGEVDPNDTTYTDGKDYSKTVALDKVGVVASTVLEYRFYASDGGEAVDGAAIGDPTSPTANTVTVTNNVPVLAWVGDSGVFDADGVDPDSAEAGSSYEFRVKYTDVDNEAPSSIQVWVDKNDDTDYLDTDEKVNLVEVEVDTDYTDGKLYHTDPDITLSTIGDINYTFTATDSLDTATGTPTGDATVAVTIANAAPVLDWTGEANYTTDGVDPDSDYGGLTFTFRVKYTDADNNPPDTIEVWVDQDDPADGYDADEKITMTEVDAGDTTYTDGKLYSADVAVPYVAAGTVPYRFYAKDSLLKEATGNNPVVGSQTVTVLDAITVCASGCTATTIQGGITAASDGDTVLVAEGTYSENVTFPTDTKGVTVKAMGSMDATLINGTASDKPVVKFTNTNPGITAVLDGFTLTNQYTGGWSSRGIEIGSSSTPTIQNCNITENYPAALLGSGIYISGASAGAIVNNTSISNNTTGKGTVYCTLGTLTMTDCHIDNNTATQENAGLYLKGSDTTSATITGGSIDGNVATIGPGIYIIDGADLDFTGGSISRNKATASNTNGGGIFANSASGTVLNLSKMKISANYSQKYGAGLYLAAGVTTTMTNCIVSGNATLADSWRYGGGIYNLGALAIDSCTFSGNYGGTGGGLYSTTATTVISSIFYGNSSAGTGVDISGALITVDYSDVDGGWGGTGSNNITVPPLSYSYDPGFVDLRQATAGVPTIHGDFHLTSGVDCINSAADDVAYPGATTEDIDDDVRPDSTDWDMGADEFYAGADFTPILTWTEEANYLSDGVDPDSGAAGSFVFRVWYSDTDNNAPTTIQVWIDRNDDGDYLDADEKVDMVADDGGDTVYSDGKIYTKTLTLSYLGDGILHYNFYAVEADGTATGIATRDKLVTVTAP